MKPVLGSSFYPANYPANRDGRAPSDIRDAFLEAIDAYQNWKEGEPEPTVELRDQYMTVTQVCGLLWNCSDILPSRVFTRISNLACGNIAGAQDGKDGSRRRTYGTAARWLVLQVAAHGDGDQRMAGRGVLEAQLKRR